MRKEMLRVEGLRKAYDEACVLKSISFNVFTGETLAILGANGAGKTSLSQIIAGITCADEGRIFFEESPLELRQYSVRQAKARGIHLISGLETLALHCTVAENIFLPYKKSVFYFRDRLASRALPYMERVHLTCDPSLPAGKLNAEDAFKVKLASALAGEPKLLLLDEPPIFTGESRRCFERLMRQYTVILVTHNLSAALTYADRLMILRDGNVVRMERREDVNMSKLYGVLSFSAEGEPKTAYEPPVPGRETAVEVCRVSTGFLREVSMSARYGEILGLVGSLRSGKAELLDLLYGLSPGYGGAVRIGGRAVTLSSPKEARRQRIIYGPWTHAGSTLIPDLNVKQSLSLYELRRMTRGGFLQRKAETHFANTYLKYAFNDSLTADMPVRDLSYGMLHKIQLAQCLSTHSRILLLNEPLDGMDTQSKERVMEVLLQQAREGAAVLLTVSADSMDVLSICNRSLVFSGGRLLGTYGHGAFSTSDLLALLQKEGKSDDTNHAAG